MALVEYNPFPMGAIAAYENYYQPSTEKEINNLMFIYWERTLFQRAASSMKFSLPKEWKGSIHDFFVYCMFRFGYVATFKRSVHGFIFQPCTLSGYNIYYQPTNVLVSNPYMSNVGQMKIGKDCQLLKLSPDYMGIWDIIRVYSEQLSLLSASLNMQFINSRVAYILGAKNKAAANALKVIMEKVSKGQSTVVYDSALECGVGEETPFVAFDRRSVKESYVGDELLEALRTVMNNFDSEIGIPVLPAEKKERMITEEAKGRIVDGMSRATIWEETFNESAKNVNAMFGSNIKVEMRYKYMLEEDESEEEGGEEDVSEGNDSGSI